MVREDIVLVDQFQSRYFDVAFPVRLNYCADMPDVSNAAEQSMLGGPLALVMSPDDGSGGVSQHFLYDHLEICETVVKYMSGHSATLQWMKRWRIQRTSPSAT